MAAVCCDTMSVECPECGDEFGNQQAVGVHRSQAHELPWQDRDTLERLYCEEGLTQSEIAEEFDTRQTTIGNWVRKFGFDRDKPWRDKEKLHKLYVEQGLQQKKIAEKWDCTIDNVCRWVDRHGLERKWHQEEWLQEKYNEERMTVDEMAESANTNPSNVLRGMDSCGIDRRVAADRPATIAVVKGYLQWQCGVNNEYVKVHRLVAIAEYGFDAVCDMVVHHDNEVRWDNRHENLELMTKGEHTAHHNTEAKERQKDQ